MRIKSPTRIVKVKQNLTKMNKFRMKMKMTFKKLRLRTRIMRMMTFSSIEMKIQLDLWD
jgi:hypothetical protein